VAAEVPGEGSISLVYSCMQTKFERRQVSKKYLNLSSEKDEPSDYIIKNKIGMQKEKKENKKHFSTTQNQCLLYPFPVHVKIVIHKLFSEGPNFC
jgi:23S rRNA-/tRNA-specific pseudouridylate synthase